MPIYEYYCKKCDKKFDVLQKISDEPIKECKFCSGPVEKLVSSSSFKFKGSGWYITDYKNKEKSEKAKPASVTKTEAKEKPKKKETAKNKKVS